MRSNMYMNGIPEHPTTKIVLFAENIAIISVLEKGDNNSGIHSKTPKCVG